MGLLGQQHLLATPCLTSCCAMGGFRSWRLNQLASTCLSTPIFNSAKSTCCCLRPAKWFYSGLNPAGARFCSNSTVSAGTNPMLLPELTPLPDGAAEKPESSMVTRHAPRHPTPSPSNGSGGRDDVTVLGGSQAHTPLNLPRAQTPAPFAGGQPCAAEAVAIPEVRLAARQQILIMANPLSWPGSVRYQFLARQGKHC